MSDIEVGDLVKFTKNPIDEVRRRVVYIHNNTIVYVGEPGDFLNTGHVSAFEKVEEKWEVGKWYRNNGGYKDYLCTLVLGDGIGILVWPDDVRYPGSNWSGVGMPKDTRYGSHEVEAPEWAR